MPATGGRPVTEVSGVWALDFQFDATTDARPLKIVSIVDKTQPGECLGGLVERSITVYPAALRCDNGPELACAALADGAGERVGLARILQVSTERKAYIGWFNGRVRDECLNVNLGWSLTQARVIISFWKTEVNYQKGIRVWAT